MIRLVYISILALFFSCSSGPEKRENNYTPEQVSQKKNLIKEVMEVHDEAMPWLDEIHTLSVELKNVALAEESNDSLNSVLKVATVSLEDADEAMMGWMRSYSEPDDTVQFQMAIDYLNNEKEMISIVRTQMKTALENAKSVLNK